MKTLIITLAMLTPLLVRAQSTHEIQQAAAIAAQLHDSMLEPPSFVLDGVYITKPYKNKRFAGAFNYCFEYRSRNRMGGYSDERATEEVLPEGVDKNSMGWGLKGSIGQLQTFQASAASDSFPGYDAGLGAPCKKKNIVADITAQVAAISPTLYKKAK